MELRQLRYFVAIFEERSISKAAARFDITQSALSAQLAHLEAELGIRLFVRAPTGVDPTPFGRALFERAQLILRQINDMKSVARHFDDKPSGTVTVSLTETIAQVLGPPLLGAVRERFPDVMLVLNEDVASGWSEKPKNGHTDLALYYDDGQLHGHLERRIVSEKLFLISKRDPKRQRAPKQIPLSDALKKPLILPGDYHGIRRQVEHVAKMSSFHIEHLAAEINSLAITKVAIYDSVGSAILPISSVAAEVDCGLMSAQELIDPTTSITLSLYATNEMMVRNAAFCVYRLVTSVVRDLVHRGSWRGAQIINGSESTEHGG